MPWIFGDTVTAEEAIELFELDPVRIVTDQLLRAKWIVHTRREGAYGITRKGRDELAEKARRNRIRETCEEAEKINDPIVRRVCSELREALRWL